MKFLDIFSNKAVWAGAIAVLAALSSAFGIPALGAVVNNPELATVLTGLVGAIAATVAAVTKPPQAS
jgi:hypothetical protein